MISILLDTNVISEAARSQADERVTKWFTAQHPENLYLSAVTVGEIGHGIAKLPHGKRRDRYEKWLHHDLPTRFADRLLPFDREAALAWGNIMAQADRQGKPRPVLDLQIAAIAIKHKMHIATRNKTDFAMLGIPLIDPWR